METDNFGKTIEKETFRVFYSDGIMDLAFGSMLIIFAVNIWLPDSITESTFILRILTVPVVIFFVLIKTFITSKRLGYVKFAPSRDRKRLKAMLVVVFLLILSLILLFFTSTGRISAGNKDSFISLIIEFGLLVIIFSLLAYFTDYRNFYIIGLAMGIGSPLSILLEPYLGSRVPTLVVMLAAGSVLFIFGAFQFIRFMNRYPKTNTVTGHEE